MKHKISAMSKSVTNAGITSDYKQAIAEYIWNGFDAGVSRVYIDYEANGLGVIKISAPLMDAPIFYYR
jgi:hypothetical protein